MLAKLSGFLKIYVACGHTDMRKSIDGLSVIVAQNFKLDTEGIRRMVDDSSRKAS